MDNCFCTVLVVPTISDHGPLARVFSNNSVGYAEHTTALTQPNCNPAHTTACLRQLILNNIYAPLFTNEPFLNPPQHNINCLTIALLSRSLEQATHYRAQLNHFFIWTIDSEQRRIRTFDFFNNGRTNILSPPAHFTSKQSSLVRCQESENP